MIAARLRPGESLGDRILKVVHAGEHGAVQIYRGQAIGARWRAPMLLESLREFRQHEMRHRALFWAELVRRGRPRCRSYVLCGVGGWTLGLVTGVLGKDAIRVTTVAVERVVLRHLAAYREALQGSDAEAHAALTAIVEEEEAHHDAFETAAGPGFFGRLLDRVVAGSTEAVIWLGMRL